MTTTPTHILLVDDDANLRTVLADYLRNKNYITMPKMNGFELLKLIRGQQTPLPVIMLTGKTDRDDVIRAYELGCDDYVTKPFSMDILICKIEAVLRRYRLGQETTQTEWQLGDVVFDSVRQQLGKQHLSSRENDLLTMLCTNMNNLVDRNRILMSIWGADTYFNARSLSVYINHLRKYLGEDTPVRIMSVHGKGYKLVILD